LLAADFCGRGRRDASRSFAPGMDGNVGGVKRAGKKLNP